MRHDTPTVTNRSHYTTLRMHPHENASTHQHAPHANTRENHPVRAADGLAGAKRVLGWSGA